MNESSKTGLMLWMDMVMRLKTMRIRAMIMRMTQLVKTTVESDQLGMHQRATEVIDHSIFFPSVESWVLKLVELVALQILHHLVSVYL